jgi:hypothetical protein
VYGKRQALPDTAGTSAAYRWQATCSNNRDLRGTMTKLEYEMADDGGDAIILAKMQDMLSLDCAADSNMPHVPIAVASGATATRDNHRTAVIDKTSLKRKAR